jgi:ribosomal protein S18 acetylase RimI-like enzyme
MTVRPARPGDGEAMARIHLEARRTAMPYLPEVHTDEETSEFFARVVAGGEAYVAETGGEVIGFAALGDDRLEHLYVDPAWQGRGAGDLLLARAKEARPGGFSLYVFQRNAGARRFYETRGLELVALGDGSENEEGEPDALYEWRPGDS